MTKHKNSESIESRPSNMGKNNRAFFLLPYFSVFFVLLLAIIFYPKEELHLMMHPHHTPFGDLFFRYTTELGGPFIYLLLLFILYRNFAAGTYLISSNIAGLIISETLKHIFAAPRPKLFFENFHPDLILPSVPGYELWLTNSFPSGHTISAFALFFGLTLISKSRWLNVLFFILAALTAYSRVYLSMHFAIDILAGSAIGVFCAWIFYPTFLKLHSKWNKRSLIQVIKENNNSKDTLNPK